jgi:hypothetical protein
MAMAMVIYNSHRIEDDDKQNGDGDGDVQAGKSV